MIERTLFSVCNDETRFHLNDVFFESDGSKRRAAVVSGERCAAVVSAVAHGGGIRMGARYVR
jgi:DNA polymerase III sliding clamp (beta) subunit (PCNA family)